MVKLTRYKEMKHACERMRGGLNSPHFSEAEPRRKMVEEIVKSEAFLKPKKSDSKTIITTYANLKEKLIKFYDKSNYDAIFIATTKRGKKRDLSQMEASVPSYNDEDFAIKAKKKKTLHPEMIRLSSSLSQEVEL